MRAISLPCASQDAEKSTSQPAARFSGLTEELRELSTGGMKLPQTAMRGSYGRNMLPNDLEQFSTLPRS